MPCPVLLFGKTACSKEAVQCYSSSKPACIHSVILLNIAVPVHFIVIMINFCTNQAVTHEVVEINRSLYLYEQWLIFPLLRNFVHFRCRAKAMEMTNKSWGGAFFIMAKLLPSQRPDIK